MSSVSRARTIGRRFLLGVLGVALVAGCTAAPPDDDVEPIPDRAPPAPRASGLPGDCDQRITDPGAAPGVLDSARPGDTVCFTGDRLGDLVIEMTSSGTPDEPVSLVADGTTMRSIGISADYVTVDGFTLVGGDGLNLKGTGIVARNNTVREASDDGIVCTGCADATLESNTVWRADGTGIVIDGENSMVRGNTVLESVMREEGDADGIRFFGTGLRIIENTIRDIKTTDYPEREAPHTDCFQTYDTRDSRPTFDVVIAGNQCENVDVQCLIATSNETRTTEIPRGVTSILFEGNTCQVNGSQGILLEYFPNVVVRDNKFAGPQYRAVLLSRGSINGTVVGNMVDGAIPPFEIDEESRPGFHAEGNTSR